MKTVTLDILDDKALRLLEDLESLKVIKLHPINNTGSKAPTISVEKYKGLMSKQPLEEIDRQLNDLRKEWD